MTVTCQHKYGTHPEQYPDLYSIIYLLLADNSYPRNAGLGLGQDSCRDRLVAMVPMTVSTSQDSCRDRLVAMVPMRVSSSQSRGSGTGAVLRAPSSDGRGSMFRFILESNSASLWSDKSVSELREILVSEATCCGGSVTITTEATCCGGSVTITTEATCCGGSVTITNHILFTRYIAKPSVEKIISYLLDISYLFI